MAASRAASSAVVGRRSCKATFDGTPNAVAASPSMRSAITTADCSWSKARPAARATGA